MSERPVRPVILLVDDNPHDVVLIRLAFRKVGVIDTIQLVKDGNEAMNYLAGEGVYANRQRYPSPSLMLLDLKMPQTSGFEVLTWIRSRPELQQLVVAVMSGSENAQDVARAKALGANLYLVKPPRFGELVERMQVIREYCDSLHKPPDETKTIPPIQPLDALEASPASV